MSDFDANHFITQPPPSHHVHRDSEPLPGSDAQNKGTYPPAPYETTTLNDPNTWKSDNEKRYGAGSDTNNVIAGGGFSAGGSSLGQSDNTRGQADPAVGGHHRSSGTGVQHDAFHEDRPLNVKPAPEGPYI